MSAPFMATAQKSASTPTSTYYLSARTTFYREVCFRFVTNAGYSDIHSTITDAEKAFDYIRNGRTDG